MTARVTYLRSFSLTQPGRLTESLSELRDIMNSVKARDADAVAKACLYHIRQAARQASTPSPRTTRPLPNPGPTTVTTSIPAATIARLAARG